MPGIVILVKIPTFRIVNAVLLGITILVTNQFDQNAFCHRLHGLN